MLRREFLRLLGLRPILAATSPNTQPEDAVVNVRQFGAVGNGAADDTESLQQAVDFALVSGRPCFFPSGRYKISTPLVIGRSGGRNLQQGLMLYGAGRAVDRRGGTGGTIISLVGGDHRAIIIVEKSVWRSASISDLGLECVPGSRTAFGLLFNSTEFSGHAVRNVAVYGAETAFGIVQGTGANGEFTLFENCCASAVDKFFYSNAGQAYVQHFNHCSCGLNSGGTYFHLDLANGGGGLNVVDFNATGRRPGNGSPSNTTLVKNGNSNSCMNFFGGRIEHLTRLYENRGGSTDLHVTARFMGLQFTVDTYSGNSGPRFVEIQTCPDIVTISSCSFEGISGNEILEVYTKESWAYVIFKACYFDSLARPPSVISDFSDVSNQVLFEDCKAVSRFGPHGRRPIPFERNYHQEIGAIGRRKAFSENGWIHSGRPVNLLAKSNFTDRNGRGVSADAPWCHFGATHAINAFDWNQSPLGSKSSSPWAKLIELPPKSGIFQDITAIDMSSTATTYHIRGADFHVIAYQAMVGRLAGNTNIRFALSDSVDGRIYDVFQYANNRGGNEFGRLVTLLAYVARKASSSYVRLSIENASVNWATIEINWQLAANDANPAFVGASGSPSVFAADWGMSTESGRFWHRLALPYKPDAFGCEASRPLDDLYSDIYLSRSTERIQSFANGRWWSAPRMTSVMSEPSSGYWAHGDIAFNAAPDPGSSLGWIQVTPGKFGAHAVWLPATPYRAGSRVYNDNHVYECVLAGISADPPGPTHLGDGVKDGSCVWNYIGPLAAVACARRWASGTYETADRVYHLDRVYECTTDGISRIPPVGLSASIQEDAVRWQFIGLRAVFKSIGSVGR
jgi:pectate lyase-like protein